MTDLKTSNYRNKGYVKTSHPASFNFSVDGEW